MLPRQLPDLQIFILRLIRKILDAFCLDLDEHHKFLFYLDMQDE